MLLIINIFWKWWMWRVGRE